MRLLTVVLFLFLTASAASAYTIVMRDGRRVEIPNEFTVTNSTVTYEVSNGFQVTIQLNTVDIAATERANGEPTGSLLQKTAASKSVSETTQTRARAGRSITNQDLEVYRKARVENEAQRQELGLPTLEDRQREVAGIEDRTLEQVRSMRAQEEAYWRSRADALRAETAANEAQLELSRQRSQGTPLSYSYDTFPGFFPFDNFGFGIADGGFNRFRRFPSSPFDGFFATPITPFPTFRGLGRRPVFRNPGVRINGRPFHMGNMRRGSHR